MSYLESEIVKLHKQGLSQREMATRLGCGINTVRRRMKELGLQAKSRGSRDYNINSHIFDTIDSEEKAYWLGFFLADACIAKSAGTRRAFRLSLKESDADHLRKAAAFLGYCGKLHTDGRDGHKRVIIVFNDTKLCSALIDHGWLNYKAGRSFEILDIIPDDLFHHFVRGYFDGDGSITYWNRGAQKKWYCNIVCKYGKPLEIMVDRITALGGPHSDVRSRASVCDIRWSNCRRSGDILQFMYRDATVYLDRKEVRKREFYGDEPYIFENIGRFAFSIRTDELGVRKDRDDIIESFTTEVLLSEWVPPDYDYMSDYESIRTAPNCLSGDAIYHRSSAGNKFVLKYQPAAWMVRQSNPPISDFADHPNMVRSAVRNFCLSGNRSMTPERLVRELRYAGFTMASLLSVPVILAAVEYFGLSGRWFDPCAGWGNRLIAASHLGCRYEATDPGVCFDGLVRMNEDMGFGAILHNRRWQDLEWPEADFILTSPPFHDKEDYLDGVDYGCFDDWYAGFLRPLAEKCVGSAKSVFHVDKPMLLALERDFDVNCLPVLSVSRHKAPTEWFVNLE